MTKPSGTILIGDLWHNGDGRINPVKQEDRGGHCGWNRCGFDGNNWPHWHSGGANYGHMDGHVEYYKPQQIYPVDAADASKDDYWCR